MTTIDRAENARRQVQLGEQMLDAMAKKRAAQTGESYVKAYAEALQSPEGRQVYAVMHEHAADSERGGVGRMPSPKRASASDAAALAKADTAEAALDRLAKADRQAGEPYEVAFDRAVQTPEGRRLYAEHCEAMEQAGR